MLAAVRGAALEMSQEKIGELADVMASLTDVQETVSKVKCFNYQDHESIT